MSFLCIISLILLSESLNNLLLFLRAILLLLLLLFKHIIIAFIRAIGVIYTSFVYIYL